MSAAEPRALLAQHFVLPQLAAAGLAGTRESADRQLEAWILEGVTGRDRASRSSIGTGARISR